MSNTSKDLYENSEFAEWLKTKPENVMVDYSPYTVDNYGTRVSVTFWIEEEEEEEENPAGWSTLGEIAPMPSQKCE